MQQKSNIGIQSYFWQSNSVLKQKRLNLNKQSYMPFLFRSKRQFPFNNNKQQSPPIGAYQISSAFRQNSYEQYTEHTILKSKFQQQKQMGIFKSKKERFQNIKNLIPGPASYTQTIINQHKKLTNNNTLIKKQKQNHIKKLLKKSPSCPAIPQNHVKYGYAKDTEGNYKFIQKTDGQLQQQKEKLKQYCSGLIGQINYDKQNILKYQVKCKNQKKQLKQNLQKIINTNKNKSNSDQENINNNKSIKSKTIKPKITFEYPLNISKIANQHELGPGCYNLNLDTFKKSKKKQQFQFFGSSQLRFPQQSNKNTNFSDNILKQKKNLTLNSNKPVGKIYKKSVYNSNSNNYYQKQQLPGPGYYDPQLAPLVKCPGNTKFGSQQRFKQFNNNSHDQFSSQSYYYPQQQYQQIQQGRQQWGYLRKDRIRSPQKQYQPVNQQQIFGIMNRMPSREQEQINMKKKQIYKKLQKLKQNKQSAVFLSRNQRLQLNVQKNYNTETNGQTEYNKNGSTFNSINTQNNKKGCFISKLPKKLFDQSQKTPGPGAYQYNAISKKTFNIKNY